VEQILQRLDKVRKQGDGYVACCPVHDDKNPSMTIKDVGDKILAYCFSCQAKGPEIMQALGLPISVIFKDNSNDFDKLQYKLDKTRVEDKLFISIYEKAKREGQRIKATDVHRYRLARSREGVREGEATAGDS
jgi:hypothetical protein